MRLDKFIQDEFELRSRTYADNLIKTGHVLVNGIVIVKPSYDVGSSDLIKIEDDNNYASQGAFKLEEAFKKFGLDVSDKICADIGCSNGGFTDCLLRHGAGKILAIDVAECALEESVLSDNRVVFIRANARELPQSITDIDFVCSDVSFISLKLVLPEIFRILKTGGEAVVLVKPQFELDKSALGKSGIVTDEKLRQSALNEVIKFAASLKFKVLGSAIAPIRYENKNIEYLLYLSK